MLFIKFGPQKKRKSLEIWFDGQNQSSKRPNDKMFQSMGTISDGGLHQF